MDFWHERVNVCVRKLLKSNGAEGILDKFKLRGLQGHPIAMDRLNDQMVVELRFISIPVIGESQGVRSAELGCQE